jgi:nucleoside-diphosphate-sugar epimerase
MIVSSEDQPSRRTIFVTGATGFIGRHVVAALVRDGQRVVAIARRVPVIRPDWFEQVDFRELDVAEGATSLPVAQGDVLIHLAWGGLPDYKSAFHFENNLPASYRFIASAVAAGVTHAVVAGTCFEYGQQSGGLCASLSTKPDNAYGIAKDTLRKFLELLQQDTPFTLQWARLFYMFGPGQNPGAFLAQLDAAITRADSLFPMSGGEQLRDYLPVEAVAEKLVVLAALQANATSNICSGIPISIRKLAEARIRQRGASIELQLGAYPYPDYEPMAFWGI